MTQNTRKSIVREIELQLGSGIIDIELDPEHYELALKLALDRYRLRSGNAMEESFIFLDVQPDVSTYTLPSDVQEIQDVYRRSFGSTAAGSGASVDPFALAFTNNLFMVQGNLGGGAGGVGSLATYEMATQYQKTVGMMFGQHLMFTWNPATKKLFFERDFRAVEQVLLHAYCTKPDDMIFEDPYARPWVRDYALAQCKLMLAQARSMFGSLAGPQGGITLNGEQLRTEANEALLRLEEEIKNYLDSHIGGAILLG